MANHDELISKSFQGSQGRAYLFNSVVNIGCGQAEERVLLTGLHAVADIYCDCCKTVLGWKYEQAYESSQKYKEGKFIIELAHMIKENGWENESWESKFRARIKTKENKFWTWSQKRFSFYQDNILPVKKTCIHKPYYTLKQDDTVYESQAVRKINHYYNFRSKKKRLLLDDESL